MQPELEALTEELRTLAEEKSITLTAGEGEIDDVLTYALFPQIGLKFLENRGDPCAFEPAPGQRAHRAAARTRADQWTGRCLYGESEWPELCGGGGDGGDVSAIDPVAPPAAPAAGPAPQAILWTHRWRVIFSRSMSSPETAWQAGDVIVVLEAMKMETEVRARAQAASPR